MATLNSDVLSKNRKAFLKAREIFQTHIHSGCNACKNGGTTAILAYRDDMKVKACKEAGIGAYFASSL